MLSNSAKYAVKAVLYLAVHSSEEQKIMIKVMAQSINVPKAYLAKILNDLSKRRLVTSTKGPKGGFYLNAENRKVKLIEILDAVEGKAQRNSCLLSLNKCDTNNPCPLHHLAFNEAQKITQNFSTTTLDELSEHVRQGKSVMPL